MTYIGYGLYILALLMTVSWIIGIRTYTTRGVPPLKSTVNICMLFVVSLIVIPTVSWSPLHLLWMFPVAWIAGQLSPFVFPLTLLMIPNGIFYRVVCIGLDRELIARNRARFEQYQQLVVEEGMTAEQAKEVLIARENPEIPRTEKMGSHGSHSARHG